MQQRRPHATVVIANGDGESAAVFKKERRVERREAKRLRHAKSKVGSSKSLVMDPYFQLALSSFTILTLTVVMVFKTIYPAEHSTDDPVFSSFQRKYMLHDHERSAETSGMFDKLRGGRNYIMPDSMAEVGDKSLWYSELRKDYDTKILPKDDERSLKFIDALQKRQGIYIQSPMARTPYDVSNCPDHPPEGYPMQWPVLEVLDNWRPDDANPHNEIYQGFCTFDYLTELHKAENYRKAELPFIIKNDPAVARTAERWNHPGYMEKLLMGDEDVMRRAEYSPNNHFMYWVDKRPRDVRRKAMKRLKERQVEGEEAHYAYGRGNQVEMAEAMVSVEKLRELKQLFREAKNFVEEHEDDEEAHQQLKKLKHDLEIATKQKNDRDYETWKPPTENLRMTYLDWVKHANVTDDQLGPDNPHWYFRLIGCGTMGKGTEDGSCDKGSSEWLFDELTFFQPRTDESRPFYMIEPSHQKGIHCRFGMKGVIAENHFDLSRNAITLLGGQRRYILGHPNQCNNMCLLPRGHPSARHSAVDWSDPDIETYPEFSKAHVNEIVMQPGDVMYLPTNWFHYIISLEMNFQCNTRSGGEQLYREEINDCGF